MKKRYLVTPGPSPVPEEVRLAMARDIIHHRTGEFREYTKEATANLKAIFQTDADVFILASSGTGAMEASVANVIGRGEKAITIEGGKFGERWTELVKAYGGEAVVLDVEWGKAADPDQVARLLKENPDAKAVYTTLCETSTATRQDIEALGKVVGKTDALLVVDGISGVGAMEMKADEWGVDMLVVGSQKALMMPPGLAFISVSRKAWGVVEKTERTVYYFDLLAARKAAAKFDTPYTASVSMMAGLVEATKLIAEEGMDAVVARHKLLADATRAAVKAIGLTLLSSSPADAVTAVVLPESIDGDALTKTLSGKYGVTVAGGQAQLKGRIIRIAHMGYMGPFDTITAVSALEMALKEMGADIPLGAGVAAAQEVFLNG